MRIAALSGAAFIAVAILWLFAGRWLSMLVDRLSPSHVTTRSLQQVRYDNHVIEAGGIRLDTLTVETLPSGLDLALGADGRALLRYHDQVFALGTGQSHASDSGLPAFDISPDPGDSVVLSTEHSRLSWPTPLEMNFMTGYAPTWRRHQYCRLKWTKRGGRQVQVLWRFKQGYFATDGWRPQTIEYGSAGLLDVKFN